LASFPCTLRSADRTRELGRQYGTSASRAFYRHFSGLVGGGCVSIHSERAATVGLTPAFRYLAPRSHRDEVRDGTRSRVNGAFEPRQPELECVLDLFGVGCGQTALGADHPMRPSCGLLGRANLFELAGKLEPRLLLAPRSEQSRSLSYLNQTGRYRLSQSVGVTD